MPSYYNPNLYYPASYQGAYPYAMPQMMQPPVQQSYAPGPACAMAWVDGEIEARGRQMPQGVTQYAMWDTNKQVIYLKSLNQMGMPNPMQIIHYTIEESGNNTSALPAGQSGDANMNASSQSQDTNQYVTKQDFEELRNEIRNISKSGNSSGNQNGNNSGNRGGNR